MTIVPEGLCELVWGGGFRMRNLPASDQTSYQLVSLETQHSTQHNRTLVNVYHHGGREGSSWDVGPTALFCQVGKYTFCYLGHSQGGTLKIYCYYVREILFS